MIWNIHLLEQIQFMQYQSNVYQLKEEEQIHLVSGIKQIIVIGLMYLYNMMMQLHHTHMDLHLKIVLALSRMSSA